MCLLNTKRYPTALGVQGHLIILADANKQALCNVLKFTMIPNLFMQFLKYYLTVPNFLIMIGMMIIFDFAKLSEVPF